MASCSECHQPVRAGDAAVPDDRGGMVCEQCQQETPADPVTAELYRRLGLSIPEAT